MNEASGGGMEVPSPPGEVGRTSASQGQAQAVEEATAQCLHLELETLGSGSNATYRRCLGCDGVIVTYGGRLWLLSSDSGRPKPREETRARQTKPARGGAP